MKKIFCLALSILFIFALISCDNAEENYDTIVYVSRYGKIHSEADCSGMIYYDTMTLSEALDKGYVWCKKCFEDIQQQGLYWDFSLWSKSQKIKRAKTTVLALIYCFLIGFADGIGREILPRSCEIPV